jgi:hypothetical protein
VSRVWEGAVSRAERRGKLGRDALRDRVPEAWCKSGGGPCCRKREISRWAHHRTLAMAGFTLEFGCLSGAGQAGMQLAIGLRQKSYDVQIGCGPLTVRPADPGDSLKAPSELTGGFAPSVSAGSIGSKPALRPLTAHRK